MIAARSVALALLAAAVASLASSSVAQNEKASQLVSVRVDRAPSLDGQGDDAVWAKAKPVALVAQGVMPKTRGTSAKVTLTSVHTDQEVFFLAVWEDSGADLSHKTWIWNKEKKAYEEGPDREDMFALAFEHTGVFNPNMLSGEEATWDVWHWKASRTNPQGYAMDKTHVYIRKKPELKANMHTARDGQPIWIARPEDAGDTVEKRLTAPTDFKGEKVPQYAPGKPTGSASDVRAKGAWGSGKWTLELGRKLNPGHKDDTAFDLTRTYKMSVAVHDKTGDMDKATGVIELSFGK